MRDPVCLRRMVEVACHRLSITPEKLWKELEVNGDLANLKSGAVSVKVLWEVAMILATMRAQKTALVRSRATVLFGCSSSAAVALFGFRLELAPSFGTVYPINNPQ